MAEQKNARPFTTDELRANASKWTLAGDVGLLGHLQKFSEDIIKKGEAAEASLNNLLDRVEETSTEFNNVSNQFLSLQNSQFLENRVYDDETPTEEKLMPVQEAEETQQQTLTKYKEAVITGLGLLDTHFEQVQVVESSDSDEEPSGCDPAKLWRPKPAYTTPLPLVIGSAEWWADDSVGLGEFLENEDSEPEPSLSDSEDEDVRGGNVEKRLRRSPSSSSSEEVEVEPKRRVLPGNISVPVLEEPEDMFKPADDLFTTLDREKPRPDPLFGSDIRPSGSGFSQQPPRDLFGPSGDDLFSDSPVLPRFSQSAEDPVFGSIQKPPAPASDILAKGGGYSNPAAPVPAKIKKAADLFDGDDEDSLFGGGDTGKIDSRPVQTKVPSAFTKELAAKLGNVAKNQDSVLSKKIEKPTPAPAITKPTESRPQEPQSRVMGLFGDDDDDEDDLFAIASKKSTVSNVRAKTDVVSGLFDDSPSHLFADAKPKAKSSINENKSLNDSNGITSRPSGKSTDLFGGDLFSDLESDDLFAPKASIKPPPKVTFPRMMLPSNDSKDDSPVSQAAIKTSTPALQGTPALPAADDLFGSISQLGDGSSISGDQSSFMDREAEDESNLERNIGFEDDSRDLGFIETSGLSGASSSQLAANSKSSPANWFQPQFSSTQAAALSNDTSGYKTGMPSTLGTVDSSNAVRDAKPPDRRISSIGEETAADNNSKRKTSSSNLKEDDLFAAKSVKATSKGEEEIEDLFSGSSVPSRVSGKSSNWGPVDDSDDLFAEPKPKSLPRVASGAANLFSSGSIAILKTDDLFAPVTAPIAPSSQFARSQKHEPGATSGKIIGKVSGNTERKNEDPLASSSSNPLASSVDDDDDLFSSKTAPIIKKPTYSQSTSSNKTIEVDKSERAVGNADLFGTSSPQPKVISKKPSPRSDDLFGGPQKATGWKSSLFEDEDDNSLFDEGRNKLPDNVSISSSRSSLFDEPSVAKSTLPSIFENKVQAKTKPSSSVFDDVEDDFDLFSKPPHKSQEEKKQVAPTKSSEEKPDARNTVLPSVKNSAIAQEKYAEVKNEALRNTATDKLISKNDAILAGDEDDDLFSALEKSVTASGGFEKQSKPPSHPRNINDNKEKKITEIPSEVDDDLFGPVGPSANFVTPNLGLIKSDLITTKKLATTAETQNKTEDNVIGAVDKSKNDLKPEAGLVKPTKLQNPTKTPKAVSRTEDVGNLSANALTRGAGVKLPNQQMETDSIRNAAIPEKIMKPKPPTSLSITKTSDLLVASDEVDGEIVKVATTKKIGKLNIPLSLKINPTALLPGAKPKKSSPSPADDTKTVRAEPVGLGIGSASNSSDPSPSFGSGVSVTSPSPDETAVTPDHVLPSAVRDRARIPGWRRPPTRKARHEALLVSGIDFGEDTKQPSPGPSGSDLESSGTLFHSVENSPSPAFISPAPSNALSPSTDEEDYFNIAESDSNCEKDDQSLFKSDTLALNVGDEETLLFDGVIKPTGKTLSSEDADNASQLFTEESAVPAKKTPSIVENNSNPTGERIIPKQESDDDLFSSARSSHLNSQPTSDDLFGQAPPRLSSAASGSKSLFPVDDAPIVPSRPVKSKPAKTNVKSLFGDSDDDGDDIFSGASAALPSSKASERPVAVAPVPKTKVETLPASFVDPLGLFQDQSD